jgi:hypothetical protein
MTLSAPLLGAGIDTKIPYSDGWWLERLYNQLRVQQKRCKALQDRYDGDAPLPFISDIQRDAVKWFVQKSRTNFERLIVDSKLSRLRIRGIRTSVDSDEGGDAEAFRTWKRLRGKLFTLDVQSLALSSSLAYVIVGKDPAGDLLVTAEDPRLCTAITDPGNPYKVLAGLKLIHDDVEDMDVAYLYLPGRVMVAKRPRKRTVGSADVRFNPSAYRWDFDIVNDLGEVVYGGASGHIPELSVYDDEGNHIGGRVPMVPYFNGPSPDGAMALFEPYLPLIDRINQQILQRMTIATVQAFRQRAFKGLPQTNPDTGELIDYDTIFTADPGAIWNIPEGVEIQELGQADLQQILLAIRDDVKDLAATSGTPLYTVTPDAANGSAEGASLQREQNTFGVEVLQDRFEISHEMTAELIFAYLGDTERSKPGGIEVIWSPIERHSMTERANAIAQTKGVLSRYQQAVEIWGMDPEKADRNTSELTADLVLDQKFAVGLAAATASAQASAAPSQPNGVPANANGRG